MHETKILFENTNLSIFKITMSCFLQILVEAHKMGTIEGLKANPVALTTTLSVFWFRQ